MKTPYETLVNRSNVTTLEASQGPLKLYVAHLPTGRVRVGILSRGGETSLVLRKEQWDLLSLKVEATKTKRR
jgi:hypothetical protein